MLGIIGKKIGMTQIFDENGKVTPVTVIQAGPCRVVGKKTMDSHGYEALQLGYEDIPAKRVKKPMRVMYEKKGSPNYRYLREFRPGNRQVIDNVNEGDEIKADFFNLNDKVSVTSNSKGRGFTGVVKRHGFAGFEQSHGVHESYRGPGSVGQCAQPSRIFKGIKMAGQHGNARVTVKHLKIIHVDADKGLILVKGAVPGHRNSLVLIQKEQ
ncbi:MAG: 50S ribosomal protein L3 [Candidatus Cloacimonetes bacterium]|nr:50S ribosomal protein L3 [Candidatus Cloacimonadota bacterium]